MADTERRPTSQICCLSSDQVCNCNQYLKISKEKMMQLMKQRGFLTDAEEVQGNLRFQAKTLGNC